MKITGYERVDVMEELISFVKMCRYPPVYRKCLGDF